MNAEVTLRVFTDEQKVKSIFLLLHAYSTFIKDKKMETILMHLADDFIQGDRVH